MEAPPTPTIYTKGVSDVEVKVSPKTLNLKSKGGNNSFTVDVNLPSELDHSLVEDLATRITVMIRQFMLSQQKGMEAN